MSELSGYRIMWLFVMFDIPSKTRKEQKSATRFRNLLLDEGFTMAQYSVYLKPLPDLGYREPVVKEIKSQIPTDGHVEIITITDKQYEDIFVCFGPTRMKKRKNPSQLTLF